MIEVRDKFFYLLKFNLYMVVIVNGVDDNNFDFFKFVYDVKVLGNVFVGIFVIVIYVIDLDGDLVIYLIENVGIVFVI